MPENERGSAGRKPDSSEDETLQEREEPSVLGTAAKGAAAGAAIGAVAGAAQHLAGSQRGGDDDKDDAEEEETG